MESGFEGELLQAIGLPALPAVSAGQQEIAAAEVDAAVLFVCEDEQELSGAALATDQRLGGALTRAWRGSRLSGKSGETLLVHNDSAGDVPPWLLLVGLGAREAVTAETVRTGSARGLNGLRALKVDRAGIAVDFGAAGTPGTAEIAAAAAEGALLVAYHFPGWRAAPGKPRQPRQIVVHVPEAAREEAGRALRTGVASARGVALARDLVNLPANRLYPERLAGIAGKLAGEHGLQFEAHGRDWLEQQGMGALLAVASGSPREPAVITLEHNAGRPELPLVVLVGKGVTFDSGRLSLKTRAGMVPMKGDMAGAAAVLGALKVIAELDLPVRVMGICACVENMPDGAAYRPSDVLVTGSGLSVEVVSTDAEGRLALAEVLWYVQRFEPAAVIDIATLTGASAAALGAGVAASLFGTDDRLLETIEGAAGKTGEKVWRMPIFPEYRQLVESHVADLKNSAGARSGVGSAAAFLEPFTDYPWAHLDMASMQFVQPGRKTPYSTQGATGYGVRLLVQAVQDLLGDYRPA